MLQTNPSVFFKSSQEGFNGYQDIISSDFERLNYLALGKIALEKGKDYEGFTEEYETVLVILSGKASVTCQDHQWHNLGQRNGVFEGKATAVYLPCQADYAVEAEADVQIAVCKAKAEDQFEPFVVTPEDIVINHRGKDNWTREVHDIIPDNAEHRVQRIILGETYNHPGKWSSYPPHKHDRDQYPEEVKLEEVYHYQINPEQGFGVQLHYTDDGDIDDAYTVRHGDSFAIDRGYHPVAAAGGYQVYYLWFLGGESQRALRPFDDPEHKWLK
ncbi:5-deoxy-glucuronate isomerase [Tuberibacillus sp. Marseille-P3662]|uniref:5-deoxy-glucuronate isomerase n=1 Tax=Tuberibacillus sp. Marseille-P3662 TaxID=1965358 RepID=UPI000A1CEED2|nr:5-deoxy-glucuronate isomerase [Tuberibacillus sp. Marseille-P3662]